MESVLGSIKYEIQRPDNIFSQIYAFADDVIIWVRKKKDILNSIRIINDISRYTGLEINYNKSNILIRTGKWRKEIIELLAKNGINMEVKGKIEYLGLDIGDTSQVSTWEKPLNRFQKKINEWFNIPTNIMNRIHIANTYITPCLQYIARFIPPPHYVMRTIEQNLSNFICNHKYYNTEFLSYDQFNGGIHPRLRNIYWQSISMILAKLEKGLYSDFNPNIPETPFTICNYHIINHCIDDFTTFTNRGFHNNTKKNYTILLEEESRRYPNQGEIFQTKWYLEPYIWSRYHYIFHLLPPKFALFSRRILWKNFLTNEKLHLRDNEISPCCRRCLTDIETEEHIWWNCINTKLILSRLQNTMKKLLIKIPLTLEDLMGMNTLDRGTYCGYLCFMKIVWMDRNNANFNKDYPQDFRLYKRKFILMVKKISHLLGITIEEEEEIVQEEMKDETIDSLFDCFEGMGRDQESVDPKSNDHNNNYTSPNPVNITSTDSLKSNRSISAQRNKETSESNSLDQEYNKTTTTQMDIEDSIKDDLLYQHFPNIEVEEQQDRRIGRIGIDNSQLSNSLESEVGNIIPDNQLSDEYNTSTTRKAILENITDDSQMISSETNRDPDSWLRDLFVNSDSISSESTGRTQQKVNTKKDKDSEQKIDLRCLDPGQWLDDSIINHYIEILSKHINNNKKFITNSYFYTTSIKHSYDTHYMTRSINTDINTCEFIYIPIHLRNHWMISKISVNHKTILLYDPLHNIQAETTLSLLKITENLFKNQFKLIYDDKLPKQTNSWDFVIFTLMFLRQDALDQMINFQQRHCSLYRANIATECFLNKIIL